MKKFISYVLIIAISVITLAGCKKNEVKETADVVDATNVTVYKVALNDINSEVNYTGEIKATDESDIAPKITATIKSMNYDVGEYVSAGNVLAVLDDTDYILAYNQALASNTQATAVYNQAVASYNNLINSLKQTKNQLKTAMSSAQIEYDNALDNYNRQKALYNAGAISKVAFESADTRLKNAELNLNSTKSNYETTVNGEESSKASAQAAVDSAKATVDSAKIALESATNNINNTQVIAPISGYIASKNGNAGQIAAAGAPLYSIKSAKAVNVEIAVTESVIPYITEGTKATVTVSTANINNIEGVVSTVNTVKNQQTGMYTVKIKIDNNEDLLKIGMMADVTLETQSIKGAITIPSDAIAQEGTEYYVYVVNGNVAEKRIVTLGISNNDFTEIKSGIFADEVVVVSGKEYISDKNNKVNIVEE